MEVCQSLTHFSTCWVRLQAHPYPLNQAPLLFPEDSSSFSQLDLCPVPEPGNLRRTGKPVPLCLCSQCNLPVVTLQEPQLPSASVTSSPTEVCASTEQALE